MTAEEYYQHYVPAERRSDLLAIRALLLKTLKGAEETMEYRMPTYSVGGEMIASLASQKNHMALYICQYELLDPFKDRLQSYDCGKSCIRFSRLKKDTLPLFCEILEHVQDHLSANKV